MRCAVDLLLAVLRPRSVFGIASVQSVTICKGEVMPFLLSTIHHASRSFKFAEGTTQIWVSDDALADYLAGSSWAVLWPDEKTVFVGTFDDFFSLSYSLRRE